MTLKISLIVVGRDIEHPVYLSHTGIRRIKAIDVVISEYFAVHETLAQVRLS
jgi:hypothetical protein